MLRSADLIAKLFQGGSALVHTLASMSPKAKERIAGIVFDSVPGSMDIPQAVRRPAPNAQSASGQPR